MLWIVIIAIIVIVIYKTNKSKKEKERQGAITREKEREWKYCNEIDDLFKHCLNNTTRMFDWHYYFEHKDPYDDKDVMSDYAYEWFLDRRFHAGMMFISYLNYFIQLGNSTLNYQNMVYEIKKRERNLLCNIVFMCGEDKCPKCIKVYVDEVYKLIDGRYPCTKERLEKIARLVPIDLQRNR